VYFQEMTLAITCSENGGWAYFRETMVDEPDQPSCIACWELDS